MSQFRLLEEIIKKLESSSIPYMLTGSIVSSLQGVPRSTHDIDVIISISEKDIEKIISNFSKEDFYYNEETIKNAVRKKSQFNLINQDYGDKIDFWLLTESGFDKSRFSRRQKIKFMELRMEISPKIKFVLGEGNHGFPGQYQLAFHPYPGIQDHPVALLKLADN